LKRRTVSIALPFAVLAPIAAWSSMQAKLTGRPGLLNDQRAIDMRQRYWLFSGERAGAELGFKPQYDLDSAVCETAQWYCENRWL
jgi:nucleoside-diphosphate-sugar epimerase